jgi:hypothetical protein
VSANRRSRSDPGLWIGVAFVAVGALFLVFQYVHFNFDVWHYAWPLFVIVPGLVMLGFGLSSRSASGLAIPGSMVTITGLLLLVQNLSDLWATWAYAWALVAPFGVGLGLILQGWVRSSRAEVGAGVRVAGIGLLIFLAGFAFFEGILHISGDLGLVGRLALPVVLIGAGLWLLIARLLPSRQF